jgi:hypothetical protein
VERSGYGIDERWYKFSVVYILFEYLKGNIMSKDASTARGKCNQHTKVKLCNMLQSYILNVMAPT